MPATSASASVKAQIIADNKALVERRKIEHLFISNMKSGNGYQLSQLDEIRAKLKAEMEAKRIEYSSPTPHNRVTDKSDLLPEDPIKCVGMFAAQARCMETTHGGSTLWTAEDDGTIGIRSGVNGSLAFRIEKQDEAFVDSLFATENTMWAGLSNGKTRIYDQQVFVLAFEGHAHEASVTSFAQTFDGKTFSASEDGSVVKWDTEANKFEVLSRITDFGCPQRCLHCYGYNLFVGGDDGIIRAFDSETNALIRVFDGHTEKVTAIVVLDGLVFSSSVDTTIGVWNIATGDQIATLKGHEQPITSLLCDPIGHHLWSADEHGTMKVWSSRHDTNFTEIHTLQHDGANKIVALKGIVAIDSVKIWTFASNGENKVWHASKNRIEESVREALRIMKTIIDQDEIELSKWADLIATLQEVARKLNSSLAASANSIMERSLQRQAYLQWLRWLFFTRVRKAQRRIASRQGCIKHAQITRRFFKTLLQFLFMKKRERSKESLATLLSSISRHRLQYQSTRHLQLCVQRIEHARNVERISITLARQASNALLRNTYKNWERFRIQRIADRKRSAIASVLSFSSDRAKLLFFFDSWTRFAKDANQRRAMKKAAEIIFLTSQKNMMLHTFLNWKIFRHKRHQEKLKQRCSRILISHHFLPFINMFFNKWLRYAREHAAVKALENIKSHQHTLVMLRNEAIRLEGLMARRELIAEAQKAIDATRIAREKKTQHLHEIMAENTDLEENIKNNNYAKKISFEKSMQEQALDVMLKLKAKLLNFQYDYPLIEKMVERCKKLSPSKFFLEAHQSVKRVVIEMTHEPYDIGGEWSITDAHIRGLKSHHAEAIIAAIKTMIITYDVMTQEELDSLVTDEEIALNASNLEKIITRCIEIRQKKLSSR